MADYSYMLRTESGRALGTVRLPAFAGILLERHGGVEIPVFRIYPEDIDHDTLQTQVIEVIRIICCPDDRTSIMLDNESTLTEFAAIPGIEFTPA